MNTGQKMDIKSYRAGFLQLKRDYLNGLRISSCVLLFMPSFFPIYVNKDIHATVRARERKIKNQDVGVKSFIKFQKEDFSCGNLVHQLYGAKVAG